MKMGANELHTLLDIPVRKEGEATIRLQYSLIRL
jgi:hypothetical protein